MADRRDLVIGTAGHIDHGKTALVRALTGVDTDRLPAEKERGITIDLGFAALELGSRRVALVDVPGHERFIRNMLAGASGLDLALLVVAADDSVMPQTREHLEILRLLGLTRGVIALTKCDLVDDAWLTLVEDEVRVLVAGSFLETAAIVRTSAATGLGIDDLREALGAACDQLAERDEPGLFRMAIDRAFTIAGHGTVVTGTVASGRVAVGDDLEWLPEGRTVRVRGIQQHGRSADSVGRGARAAINLVGVHHAEVTRGQELAAPGYLEASRLLGVELRASPGALRALRDRGRYRLHVGTAEVAATLVLLEPDRLEVGEPGLAQLHLLEPVGCVHGQPFVLREESPPATLGGGRILQPCSRRIRRRDGVGIERMGQLASTDASVRLSAALATRGLAGWTERGLARDTGLPVTAVGEAVERLVASGALVSVPVGPRRTATVPLETVRGLEDRVVRLLGRLHRARPRLTTLPRSWLASPLADLGSDSLVAAILERLRAAGRVVGDARSVALADFAPKLSHGERKLKLEIAEAFRTGGFSPPDVADWTAKAGNRAPAILELFALLRDEETLVELAPGLFLDREFEIEMRKRVATHLGDGRGMTVAELRDLLGTTRKFAVPLAEYLDRIALTRREGDLRFLAQAVPLDQEVLA
jgi:selenocysteine-specific elongation factor